MGGGREGKWGEGGKGGWGGGSHLQQEEPMASDIGKKNPNPPLSLFIRFPSLG